MVYVVRMAWYRDDSVTAIRDDVVISIVKTIHNDVMAGWNGNGNNMNGNTNINLFYRLLLL